jgi:threonine aldolase
VDKEKIRINMVFWKTENPRFNSDAFVAFMLQHRIKMNGIEGGEYRFVTHNDITREDIDIVTAAVGEYVGSL